MTIQKVCANVFQNTGNGGCESNNPFTDHVGLFITTDDFQFDTFADFADETKWTDGIKAGKIHPIQNVDTFEDQSEDAQYYESPNGKRTIARAGKYRFMYSFVKSFEVHKQLQSFKNAKARFFILDSNGNVLYGYSPDGTVIKGSDVSMLSPEKLKNALQDNTPAFTAVVIDLKDSKQWNENGQYVNPGWDIEGLDALVPVDLEVTGVPTATEIIVKVTYNAGLDSDGAIDEVGISGLLLADFVVSEGSPSTSTDNGDGTYTIAGTAFATGTINLVAPSALTAGLLIESTGAASFTI